MTRKQFFTILASLALSLTLAGMVSAQGKKGAAPAANEDNLMDLNSATLEKLMTLNEVDLMTARKIVAARPFADKKQLVQKKVMTQEAFDKIARSVTAKAVAKEAKAAPAETKGGKKKP